MKIKAIIEDDFINYKKPSLFIGTCYCNFKCCVEANLPITTCQNNKLSLTPTQEFSNRFLIQRFLEDPIMRAVVFGGMEPFMQFDEVFGFIEEFRKESDADVIIYTGYTEAEVQSDVQKLSQFPNIIVKFGRFVPNQKPHFDPVLGVELASDNQYAIKIS